MNSTWEKIDKNKVKLSVEVQEERVEDAYSKLTKSSEAG